MAKETAMGFEGILYYGAAGSTASTALTNVRDVTLTQSAEQGDTSVRGTGSGPIVTSSRVVALTVGISFNMVSKSDDTSLAAMLVAAMAGTPVALRAVGVSGGLGPDLDFNLGVTNGQPFKGEQTYDFEAIATDEQAQARAPTTANVWV